MIVTSRRSTFDGHEQAIDSLHPSLLLNKIQGIRFLNRNSKTDQLWVSGKSLLEAVRGCSQWSSFGPLLWNISQNDMTYHNGSLINMYADDHDLQKAVIEKSP